MIIFNKLKINDYFQYMLFLFVATDKDIQELTLHIIHVFFIKFSKLNIFH